MLILLINTTLRLDYKNATQISIQLSASVPLNSRVFSELILTWEWILCSSNDFHGVEST